MQHKAKKWMLRIGLVFLSVGIAVLSVFAYAASAASYTSGNYWTNALFWKFRI